MSFGLKNIGATYQRMMNKTFAHQISRNMEVYVNDMIVKSKSAQSHLTDLTETFKMLRKCSMCLNPDKCVFKVCSGKFLGFIIHQRGIDTNSKKVQAIINMEPPQLVKEVQRLARRLTSLARFLSRFGDKCLPFFRILKNPKDFEWTSECQ